MINFSTEKPIFTLYDNIIDIWICRSDLLGKRKESFFELLSAEEKTRAERFKFDLHRNQFIAFHGFMRTVLAKYLAIDAAEIQFRKGDKGKPFLETESDFTHSVQFNLSHTRDIAILAVTQEAEVGIDIEHIDRKTDWQGVCQRFFTETEQQALFSLKTLEEQMHAFYELWTRKEAYMKVLGTGLSLSPTQFTLTVPPEKPALVQHHSTTYPTEDTIEFTAVTLPDFLSQYRATLAVASSISECRYYDFGES